MAKEKVIIEFSQEEAMELMKLINVVVKQVGIEDGGELVSSCLYFTNKLNESFASEETKKETEPELNGVSA